MSTKTVVYIPLQGPSGIRPKAPAVGSWQSPGYVGIEWCNQAEWVGMRCDGLVVIDCDTDDAAQRWMAHVGRDGHPTWTRKTPRGWHFIYTWTPDSPDTPSAGVWAHTDIRAGRTSQIVMFAPGYRDAIPQSHGVRAFDPKWLPENYGQQIDHSNDESWDEMPEGRGNNTMAAFAGAFRKQGMSPMAMAKCLGAINRITMTESPMAREEIAQIVMSVARYAARPDADIEVEE